jgi:hypothetical protein
MQMMYLLHTQPGEDLARRLRGRFPSLFGGGRQSSEARRERAACAASISDEEILADLHYGRAA